MKIKKQLHLSGCTSTNDNNLESTWRKIKTPQLIKLIKYINIDNSDSFMEELKFDVAVTDHIKSSTSYDRVNPIISRHQIYFSHKLA